MPIYSFAPFHVSKVIAVEYLSRSLGTYFRGFFVLCFCICSRYGAFTSAVLYLDGGKNEKYKPTFSIVAQVICSDIKSQMRV